MKLTFKGGKTNACLSLDTNKKTYTKWFGVGSGAIRLDTQKELKELEIDLIRNDYKEESYLWNK